MAGKLNKNDRELLMALAEYRILTVGQIAALQAIEKPAARKRVGKLARAGLTVERTPATREVRGRPERWISLSKRGVEELRAEGVLSREIATDQVAAEQLRCAAHQLAMNWFRLHLVQLERTLPRVKVAFLASESPFLERSPDGQPLILDRAPCSTPGEEAVAFIPDGVFTLRDEESGRALLFFLEVDMGTESLGSRGGGSGHIRGKVSNYQQYFRAGTYKRYQELWNCELNGFRLLFLAQSPARLAALCRLVRQVPPCDFIWLTDQVQLLAHGSPARIWVRGGNSAAPLESIVGARLAREAPLSVHRPHRLENDVRTTAVKQPERLARPPVRMATTASSTTQRERASVNE